MDKDKEKDFFNQLLDDLYRHQFKQVQERVKSGTQNGEDLIFIREHLKAMGKE